jgi:hypothetical protein
MRKKKKKVEVEQPIPGAAKPKAVLAVTKMEIPLPLFKEGDKVRFRLMHTTGYNAPQWEKEPYRVLSRSLQYRWNNDMKFAYLYRLQRCHTSVEWQGWAAWAIATEWEEDQLELWDEEKDRGES